MQLLKGSVTSCRRAAHHEDISGRISAWIAAAKSRDAVLPSDYLDFIAPARQDAEPFRVPRPMPCNPASFPAFTTYAVWRAFVVQFSLHPALPLIVSAKFERAQKLCILTWIDFDLIKAGELMALTALELALTGRRRGPRDLTRGRRQAYVDFFSRHLGIGGCLL
jgi:hypothetical protein